MQRGGKAHLPRPLGFPYFDCPHRIPGGMRFVTDGSAGFFASGAGVRAGSRNIDGSGTFLAAGATVLLSSLSFGTDTATPPLDSCGPWVGPQE